MDLIFAQTEENKENGPDNRKRKGEYVINEGESTAKKVDLIDTMTVDFESNSHPSVIAKSTKAPKPTVIAVESIYKSTSITKNNSTINDQVNGNEESDETESAEAAFTIKPKVEKLPVNIFQQLLLYVTWVNPENFNIFWSICI